MGLFDTLFGGSSKPEPAPEKQSDPVAVKTTVANIQPEAVGAAAVSADMNSEIVAAIAASISCVMDTSLNAELLAAISAAVVHHGGGGVRAVKIQHASSSWAFTGRQKLMDSRQFA